MNNHQIGPGGVPDLGTLGQPQQIQLLPALIFGRVEGGAPAGFWDGVTLVALIREAIRDDMTEIVRRELRSLLTDEELTQATEAIDQSYLEALANAGGLAPDGLSEYELRDLTPEQREQVVQRFDETRDEEPQS